MNQTMSYLCSYVHCVGPRLHSGRQTEIRYVINVLKDHAFIFSTMLLAYRVIETLQSFETVVTT